MKKRLIAFTLILCLVVGTLPIAAFASTPRDFGYEISQAETLKTLGLFQGVSDTDFALGRAPSRTEALVMLIRVLGCEEEALSGTYSHPFTDVISWADAYVGYAYENGLTTGISATEFGTGDANAQMYLTFMLRALGYSDADGDFSYADPFTLAEKVGILNDAVETKDFLRGDVAIVSYEALDACMKGSDQTLADTLIAKGVFTAETLKNALENSAKQPDGSRKSAARAALVDYIVENGEFYNGFYTIGYSDDASTYVYTAYTPDEDLLSISAIYEKDDTSISTSIFIYEGEALYNCAYFVHTPSGDITQAGRVNPADVTCEEFYAKVKMEQTLVDGENCSDNGDIVEECSCICCTASPMLETAILAFWDGMLARSSTENYSIADFGFVNFDF